MAKKAYDVDKEIRRVNEFMEKYSLLNVLPYYAPCNYYLADRYAGIESAFCITDDEGMILQRNFTTFDDFVLWFIGQVIVQSNKAGTATIRKALKEIIGITVR
jgi:hypothetical protein